MAKLRAIRILLPLTLCLASNVAQANCSDAIDTIESAISNLSNALQGYLRCLSDSNGHDDCASEFRSLTKAQGADIHDGPEHILQSESEYIDARPPQPASTKASCTARTDHTFESIASF